MVDPLEQRVRVEACPRARDAVTWTVDVVMRPQQQTIVAHVRAKKNVPLQALPFSGVHKDALPIPDLSLI